MAVICYVAEGKKAPTVKLAVSMNKGAAWREQNLVAGQSWPIPPNATNLLIDNVPYDPKGNYEIRQGKVARK